MISTLRNMLARAVRVAEDEPGEELDEPPERDQADSFKRQQCRSPPRHQSSLLSQMLASPVSDLDATSDCTTTSRNTTPTPPPLAVQLPCAGIMTKCVLKRSIKFACAAGKDSDAEDESHIVHPQPQRLLLVDGVLSKERVIARLNAEVDADVEAEAEAESTFNEKDGAEDNEDDEDEDESLVMAPGSVRGRMLARLERTPFVEYESDGESEHGNVSDGYASDDDGDDDVSEYNGPIAAIPAVFAADPRKHLHRVQRPATPPANLVPDSSDFVCGTFDEDRPIEVAYYSAREEHARLSHKPCPQDIDPSFPEEQDESDDEPEDGMRGARSPMRSPRQHHSDYAGKAASFQHVRPVVHARPRQRGAIDIVKGLERKNNKRRQQHRDVQPGAGLEKMRQLGLDSVRNNYSEWMLSV